MVIGNCPHDTPADEALRVARRLLAALPSGPRLVLAPSPFSSSAAEAQQAACSPSTLTTSAADATTTSPPPAFRIYAPYVLTKMIYVAFLDPAFGR